MTDHERGLGRREESLRARLGTSNHPQPTWTLELIFSCTTLVRAASKISALLSGRNDTKSL